MQNKRYENVKNYINAKKPEEIKKKSKEIKKFKNTLLNEIIKNWNYYLIDAYQLDHVTNEEERKNLENWLAYRNHKLKRISRFLTQKYLTESAFSSFMKMKDKHYSIDKGKAMANKAKEFVEEKEEEDLNTEEIVDILDEISKEDSKTDKN